MGQVIKVCAIGLEDKLLSSLRSICKLSRHPSRAVAFEVVVGRDADIGLVDPESAGACAEWSALDPQHDRPLLMLEPRSGSAPPQAHVVSRPVLAARLLARLDLVARGLTPRHDAAASAPANGLAVLVVDDSVTVRTQVELALRQKGYSPTLAESGEQALDLVARYRFDLVLLDVVLPGADGYQVCRTLKRQGRGQAPAVVMLTSKSSPFDRVRGSLAGCDSYLTKPTSVAELQAVLERHAPRARANTVVFSPVV
jgi:two-component system, cell cycle response regulator